jgi:hypothetical protein
MPYRSPSRRNCAAAASWSVDRATFGVAMAGTRRHSILHAGGEDGTAPGQADRLLSAFPGQPSRHLSTRVFVLRGRLSAPNIRGL